MYQYDYCKEDTVTRKTTSEDTVDRIMWHFFRFYELNQFSYSLEYKHKYKIFKTLDLQYKRLTMVETIIYNCLTPTKKNYVVYDIKNM